MAGTKTASEAVKKEFAARLAKRRLDRGWSQATLAAQASHHMGGKKMGRNVVWNYENAINVPTDAARAALAKALGCAERDLFPDLAEQRPANTKTLETMQIPDEPDKMRLVINDIYPTEKVLRVLAILVGENGKGD